MKTKPVVVEFRNGKITLWREYQRPGLVDLEEFLETGGKKWKWTIDTYP